MNLISIIRNAKSKIEEFKASDQEEIMVARYKSNTNTFIVLANFKDYFNAHVNDLLADEGDYHLLICNTDEGYTFIATQEIDKGYFTHAFLTSGQIKEYNLKEFDAPSQQDMSEATQ